ncbi:MAG: transposase [Phycisphaerales bacterium]|nr:transposase [Phycisphaerales bacterium]
MAVDLSKIFTDYRFTPAKEHDSRHIDDLPVNEDKAVIVYSDRRRREELRRRGVIDAICSKRNRGQEEFYGWQERWNTTVSRLRARVENPLGMLKQQFGHRRVRYRGRQRNEFDFAMMLTECNLKRSLSLGQGEPTPGFPAGGAEPAPPASEAGENTPSQARLIWLNQSSKVPAAYSARAHSVRYDARELKRSTQRVAVDIQNSRPGWLGRLFQARRTAVLRQGDREESPDQEVRA